MDEDDDHKTAEMLDVEDVETRQNRIKSLLENLNSSFTSQVPRAPKFDFADRTTFSVQPPTELLSRVQSFLPKLEASNVVLARRVEQDPSSVDIEHISEGVNQYIEMNLGLGLFEDRSKRKDSHKEDSEMSVTSSSSSSSSDASDGSGTVESEDSDSEPEIITSFVPIRRIKPLPRRATNPRPNIVVIGEDKA